MIIKGLVSVIVPTFNRSNLLLQTVDSVLKQTYQNFEIIIIDDGSTDETPETVKRIDDPRITYQWYENSGLPAVARNRGLSKAKGEFIAFLDSDDLWMPEKLEKQVAYMNAHPDIFLVYTKCFIQKNGVKFDISPTKLFSGNIFNKLYMSYNLIPCMTVMMRNGPEGNIYYFDEERNLRAMEDYDLWLTISFRNKIGCIDEPLAVYVLHSTNISFGVLETLKKWYLVMKKYSDYVPTYMYFRKQVSFYFTFFFLLTHAITKNILNYLPKHMHGRL